MASCADRLTDAAESGSFWNEVAIDCLRAVSEGTVGVECRHNRFNPLNPELNPICCLLTLLAHHFLHVSRIRVKSLTLRQLRSYIYIYIYIYNISCLRVKLVISHWTNEMSFFDTFTNIILLNISIIKYLFLKNAWETKMTTSRRTSRRPV